MTQSEKSFKYFVSRRNAFLVVSLVGAMVDKFLADLEQCKKEVLGQNDVRALVLNFAEVSEIGNDAIPLLAQLQAAMRSRGVQLRLTALQPDVLDKLE
jgi:anti-anti-sigma regulatory factor